MHGLDNSIPQNEEKIIDIGKYFTLIKRNWLKVSLFTILVTIVTALIVFSLTPKYTATATLLIEPEVQKVVSFEDLVGVDTSKKGYYQTQIEILKSRQISQRVVDKLNLDEYPEFNSSLITERSLISTIRYRIKSFFSMLLGKKKEPMSDEAREARIRQNVVNSVQGHINVTAIDGTQLVNIEFTSKDPELAAKGADAVGDAYIESNLDARLDTAQQASSWISGRLESLRQELRASEDKLTDFLRQEKLIDDSGIDSQASSIISDLTLRLSQIRDSRIQLESAYSTLKNRGNDLTTIPSISKHPQVVALRNVLASAQKDVTELSKRYGPKHEKMKAAIAKRDSAREELNNLLGQLVSEIKKELDSVSNQERLIQEELQRQVDKFQDITVKKREYQSLSREVETNRNILNVFLNRYKETAATGDYKTEYARFADRAQRPLKPSKPNKKLLIVAAFVGSLLFAIGMLILIDILKHTITSMKQFEERMGFIPLGGIPKVKLKKGQDIKASMFFDDNESQFSESVRAVRTALTLSAMRNHRKGLVFSSSLKDEGKTTTAVNVAQSFAQMENVILVDADLRKPSVAERFGYSKYQQGITNHILMGADLEQCIIKDKESGLNILPAGMLTPNPQELLSSKEFSDLLNVLFERYDRVIIDTPPTLLVNDSLVVAKIVGSVCLIAKADATRFATLRNTIARFIHHNIALDGVVINQIKKDVMSSYYAYGDYQSKKGGKYESPNMG
ncbi:GumC family protein [Vibrio olivae]|uniref:non-specific protein-tyrosine kinase n=1 Tax=Vibrio olivae TaxID=1243002 RepID=A0ABV5HNA7_9VIBR